MQIDPGNLADLLSLQQRQATNEKLAAIIAAEKKTKQEQQTLAIRKEILFNAIKQLDGAWASLRLKPTETILEIMYVEDVFKSYSITSSSFDTIDFKVLADKAWGTLNDINHIVKAEHKSALLRIATEKANVIKELEIEDFSLRQRHTSKSESTAQKLAIAFGTVFLISFTSYKFINEGDKLVKLLLLWGIIAGFFTPSIVSVCRLLKARNYLCVINMLSLFLIICLKVSEVGNPGNIKTLGIVMVLFMFGSWALLLLWALKGPRYESADQINANQSMMRHQDIKEKIFQRIEAGKKEQLTLLSIEKNKTIDLYHISKGQHILGQMTKPQVVEMLINGTISLNDHFFDEHSGEWKTLKEMGDLQLL